MPAPGCAFATAFFRPPCDVAHRISRERLRLHRARFAAHVHQDEGQLAAAGNFGDAWIPLKRGDVVDHFCAGFGGSLRYFGLIRVNRNWNFEPAAKHVQHGNHPAQLFIGSEPFGAGAGGFAADVEDVGAVAFHLERTGDGRFHFEMQTIAGEAVGRYVEHSHQQRALAEHEGAGWQTEAEFLSGDHSLKLGR